RQEASTCLRALSAAVGRSGTPSYGAAMRHPGDMAANLRHEPHTGRERLGGFHAVDELFEDAHVQSRGGVRLRVELRAEGEPVGVRALDGFDHAVGTAG